MSLSGRLIAGSMLVIATLVAVVVLISGARLRDDLFDRSVSQLEREARFVAEEWAMDTLADALADRAGAALGHRVTLISGDGRVLGDSEFDDAALARLENHRERPEVRAATREGRGWSLRASPSAGDEELYVAVRAPRGVSRVSIPTREFERIAARAQRDVIIAGLVALVVAMALSALFSRMVSKPIGELRDVAQALAAGDLSRRPSLAAPGEVGDLAAAVHRMAEQLDVRLRALEADDQLLDAMIESLNEGVIVVDDRRQVIRANASARRLLALRQALPFPADQLPRDRVLREGLAEALKGEVMEPAEITAQGLDGGPRAIALQARPLAGGGAVLALFDLTAVRRLETVRRDFVANVSHELRTPLSVIIGFAETLEGGDDIPPDQRHRFSAAIASSAQRMQRIVDDLLDLSRIESGGWVPKPVPLAAATALGEAVAPYRAEADRKGVALSAGAAPDAASVYADPTAVRQVVANLVDNALRHTPAGGRVEVTTQRDAHGSWIAVSDTGAGIPAEHLPRIFERFYRVDPARSRAAGGTGLGLAIVRHMVEAHGGRVEAESALRRGTTVRAFFPDAAGPLA